MPKVQAYQCPHTKKLFIEKSEYQSHLRRLASKRRAEHKEAERRAAKEAFWARMRSSCCTAADLEQFITQNWDHFVKNACDMRNYRSPSKTSLPRLKNIQININFSKSVACTHSAPLGQRTNWWQTDDLPKAFPAFQGPITFELDGAWPGFTSVFFEGTGIHTTSGSGWACRYGYGMILWVDDWPAMAQAQIIKILSKP